MRRLARLPVSTSLSDARRLDREDLTAHLIDAAGAPTMAARDEILALFTARLLPTASEEAS